MKDRNYTSRRRRQYRLVGLVFGVAAIMIVGILLMGNGSDESDPEGQILPPVTAAEITGDTTEVVTPETSQAIDGAPLPPATGDAEHSDHADHDHELPEQPAEEATAASSAIKTATEYATLSINRPTDPVESAALNQQLITLATGRLALDLANPEGQVATAQAASQGQVLQAIELTRTGNYAEVLIVAKESVVDASTKQTLDPRYINYLVRLDKTANGKFAVTSWEPQL